MSQSDEELVNRVLVLNDRQAYCDLVRKYQVDLRSYLARLVRNPEWAGDLAQEAFLTGYRKLNQLKNPAKFRSWIYSIAHTEFLQWNRGRALTESLENWDSGDNADVFAGTEVRLLFKGLRAEECSAVTLCLAHDFTHAEAAQMLGLPVGTVKSLILRARIKMGAKL
ncbi:MAG: RNA polymerase sigma factor [Bdellovibrionales bacterium]